MNWDMSILITNYSIQDYAGAELNCLELAKTFRDMGAIVEVATFNYAYPVREEYEKEQIKVTNVFFDELNHKEYDLIWAHHYNVLSYLIWEKGVTASKIIYSSLSPFEYLESPPVYASDLTLCLANSEETKQQLIEEGVQASKVEVFPNYVLKSMLDSVEEHDYKKSPVKIAIVSNHVPSELHELEKRMLKDNIKTDIYGKENIVKRITADVLNEYDMVITIGKTVQYAMALKIPVYCYDIHGGFGFINSGNIIPAFEKNFSGRGGFGKKSGEELYSDIINNYSKNIIELEKNRDFILKHCQLENNINKLFSDYRFLDGNIDSCKLVEKYNGEKRRNNSFVREYRYNLYRKMEIIDLNEEKRGFEAMIEKKEAEIDVLDRKNSETEKQVSLYNMETIRLFKEMELKDCQISDKQRELNAIKNSKWWRILARFQKIENFFSCHKRKNSRIYSSTIENGCEMVSVVIPVYDRTDVLKESIESILRQTYPNIELIIVCDGSPQPTLDVVKMYENHEKVRVFYYRDNSGNAVRGRNKAIREARGKYLAFQDSDDIAENNRLEISVEYMKKYDADVVYGGYRALVDGSRKIDIENGQEIYSPDCDFQMLKEICVPCQSTVMVKVDALRAVGGLKTKMRYREDHELWLRLAYNGYKFKSIDKVLTNLRLHENNLELTFKDTDDKWKNLMMEEYARIEKIPPKIAYVIPGCGISGGIAVVCQHLNRLKKRGFDVLLITEDDKHAINWFPEQTVDVVSVDDAPTNIDIVVATGWSTAYTASRINAKKKYYFVQSDESRFNPKFSEAYYRAICTYTMDYQIITEAKWIKEWLYKEYNKKAYYVPNGLDSDIIYKTDPIEPKGDKIRVLLEGPIDIPFKGMEDAFAAVKDLDCEVWCISSLGKPHPDWHCDRFFETVPMEKMNRIYSSCDIFLKMSRVEGFFGPPLEMMACGGACVVGKVTGYDEYIVDGYNALVVEQGDVSGAHDAIQRLIDDKDLRNRIIENGYQTSKQWRWEKSIDKLEEIFMNYDKEMVHIDDEA